MKNALILHGKDNSSKNNWFLWLSNKLQQTGYEVLVPDLPHWEQPNIDRCTEFLLKQKWELNSESILVGHSAGAIAILGLLQTLPENIQVEACYLVGSFKDNLSWESLSDLFLKPFDFTLIKKKAKKFVFIHSNDDPYCPLSHAKFLHQQLGGELIIQPGQKHFSMSTAGEKYKQFPFLLELITHDGFTGLIHDFLKQYQLMAVATNGEHPWISNVYYAVDDALNLYFLSSDSCLHSQHIQKNKEVAVSIYDSALTPIFQKNFNKVGMQMFGHAEKLENENEIRQALTKWKEALNIRNDHYSYEKMVENKVDGRMYKITPKKIKMFSDELFDEDEVPMLELV